MKENKKPFFAAFLEKQIQEPNKINGGKTAFTLPRLDSPTTKTPHGGDEVTLKYPSDGDEDIY